MNFSKYNVMPQPYSEDLRWRVVWLCLFHHKSELEVANLLHISTKTVERYLERFLSTGNVAPDQRKNGPDKTLSMYEEMLLIQPAYHLSSRDTIPITASHRYFSCLLYNL